MNTSNPASPGKTPVYGQTRAPSANVTGANGRIAVGIVGLGPCHGQNRLFLAQWKSKEDNTAIAAVCDVFNKRRDFAGKKAGLSDSSRFSDYRRMLERKDLDAVLVATHDPLHAQISLDALDAGKHVYCEVPMTRYLDEAFRVYDRVKSSGKVFQVGAVGCAAGAWRKCAELIQAGKLGTLVWGQASYCRNSVGGEWNYPIEPEATPENIDWEKWLGPVRKRPFSAEHFRRWHKYFVYSAGPLGCLAAHRLHPLLLASGHPEFPTRVNCIGTHHIHSDTSDPEREVPGHARLIAEFPSGYTLTITCGTVNARSPGYALCGHKATLNIGSSGERVELVPEKEFANEIDPETFTDLQAEDLSLHLKNWLDCIRSNQQPVANVELAIRVQTILSLAEMSDRLKLTCLFEEKSRRLTDSSGKEVVPISYNTVSEV